MCLVLLAWRVRDDLPLVVAANRDEWRDRPAEAAHWWPGKPAIFAGRDLKAGGTWMGISRQGRFAAVTNFRDPTDKRSTARSRGELVTEYLRSAEPADLFIMSISQRASDYNGFNLIVGDTDSLWYFGSHEGEAREIEPGVHGLSNHVLDEPWPKVTRGRAAMEAALKERDPSPRLFEFLGDSAGVSDADLPKTGVGLEWERRLAAPLITGEDYGTRSSTVLAMAASGKVHFEERTLGPQGEVLAKREERLPVKPV
ncbi:MAG TPA: NRDE family protein [Usitatibacter sp.]|nr:NRDE family protein [Usitatibacter sp.]